MSCVERAIIMAAGKGTRMEPLTLTTPKPLIKVYGKSMIESVIDALHENDINEIYIVVGYLKDQFGYLVDKYPGCELIDNPYYDSCNNISSLYVARNHIENAIILDGDQIINTPDVLGKSFEYSGYNAVWTEKHTKEWLLNAEDGVVTSCSRDGGERGWQLYSVSRWTAQDGKKLKLHLEREFEDKKNHHIYWDDIAFFCYPSEYKLVIRPMDACDVVEIDSIAELKEIDESYK